MRQRVFAAVGDQPRLDALDDGDEPAEQVPRGHQVRQEIDPARLRDVVGILALRQVRHGRGYLDRLSR